MFFIISTVDLCVNSFFFIWNFRCSYFYDGYPQFANNLFA